MNINWDEISNGMNAELHKKAGVPINPAEVDAVAGGVATGAKTVARNWRGVATGAGVVGAGAVAGVPWAAGRVGSALGGVVDGAMGYIPGLLGMMGGFGGGAGKSIASAGAGAAHGYGGRMSLLSLPKGEPTSMMNPVMGPANKLAGFMDNLTWAAKNRVANHMINTATGTKPEVGQVDPMTGGYEEPYGATTSGTPHKSEKEQIELVTKYPEIQEMLKNPETRKYLETLLTQQQ